MEQKRIFKVNGKEYAISVMHASSQKTKNMDLGLDVNLRIMVANITDRKAMTWKEIKGSYLQEKIEEYIVKNLT